MTRVWMESSPAGSLESPDVLQALFGRRPRPVLEQTCDQLADAVDKHLDTALLRRLTCST